VRVKMRVLFSPLHAQSPATMKKKKKKKKKKHAVAIVVKGAGKGDAA